jgi:hypothetical protein
LDVVLAGQIRVLVPSRSVVAAETRHLVDPPHGQTRPGAKQPGAGDEGVAGVPGGRSNALLKVMDGQADDPARASLAFCSIAGVLFVVYSQTSYPTLLQWTTSGEPVIMAVVGGMFAFLGPVIGAFVYTLGHYYVIQHTAHWQLILGAVLLAIVLLRPDGLAGLVRLRRRRT